MSAGTELRELLTWLQRNDITWNSHTVDIRGGNKGTAPFAVFAKQDIAGNEPLCEIPKSAVLSVKNTKVADLIETEQLGGGLGLILAIMYEYSIAEKSKWNGYLQSLPKREYLPLFWTDAEVALLTGTELAGKAAADRAYTKEDWETHLLPLVQQAKYPELSSSALTLDLFRAAASWVASRAFGVDSYHGMAMVPLADLFNHKAAVVQLGGAYTVEDICFEDMSESDQEENGAEAADVQSDQSNDSDQSSDAPAGVLQLNGGLADIQEQQERNMLQPMTLEADRGPSTRGAMLDPAMQQEPKLRLEIGICGITKPDGTEVLEIMAASPLEAGKEIFNTYGEHGNAELVNKYGFALPDNPFDTVKLDKQNLVALAKQKHGSKACNKRCKFLDDHSHLLEEEEEPFEVLPSGKINPSLLMILRTLFATSKQFAAWQTLDDALPSEAPTSAAFVPVPADMQAGSELPAATPALHTRSAGSSSSDETLPQTKRQKLDPVHDHNQQANHVPANTTSAADASDSFTDTIGPGSKNGVKRHASQPADVTNESEEEGGLSSQEDESLGNDSEGGQLGNISIADSSEDVLSHAMLHALEAAIQHRLQQYATPSVDAEQKALKRTQEAAVWQRCEALQAQQAAYQLLIGEKSILLEADKAVVAALK